MIDDLRINEVEVQKLERIGTHSHIVGLGLDDNLNPLPKADGMVGQLKARKAAGIVAKMIKDGGTSGRAILIVGKTGSGKTAIAHGIAKSISRDTPFVSISGSEVFSLDLSKAETLTQAFRKAIAVRIDEEAAVLEGEVVEIQISRTDDGSNIRVGKLTLKTTNIEAVFDLGQKMIDNLIKEKIAPGDIISINKTNGQVSKLGRTFSRNSEFDAIAPNTKFIACPDGEIEKRRTVSHSVTLHEIDVINSKQQGFVALFSGDTGEIRVEDRMKVNAKISEWRDENKAIIQPGVLFIDEVHMLDIECFSFLNRAMEDEFAPILILATNRGYTTIRGTEEKSPHGLPPDFLDRVIIIRTAKLQTDEIAEILSIRAYEEDVKLDEKALLTLVKIAADVSSSSLRYSLQLISAAHILAQRRRSAEAKKRGEEQIVMIEDVRNAYELFMDKGRSERYISQYNSSFIFDDKSCKQVAKSKALAAESAARTTRDGKALEEEKAGGNEEMELA